MFSGGGSKVQEVDDNSLVFRLFTRNTVCIFVFAAALISLNQLFKDPIDCWKTDENGTLDKALTSDQKALFENYCWTHASQEVDYQKYEDGFCIKDRKAQRQYANDGRVKSSPYHNMPMYLVITALLFKIPGFLWTSVEANLMSSFYSTEVNSKRTMITEHDKTEYIESYGQLFEKVKGQYLWYYYSFFFCEILNLMLAFVSFHFLDESLDGHFSGYGLDVWNYFGKSAQGRKDSHDPRCNAFPTLFTCEMKLNGNDDVIDGFCLISQNAINQKIFVLVWAWFIVMFILGALQLIIELLIMGSATFRLKAISFRMGTYCGPNIQGFITVGCNIGDWFVLYQISKNTDKHFFHELMEHLASMYAFNIRGNTNCNNPHRPKLNKKASVEYDDDLEMEPLDNPV